MQSLTHHPSTARAARRERRGPCSSIGEALIDRFADGDVVGGAPFNVARSLAAFGVPTTFISRIGDNDEDGARVLASALRFGLHDGPIQRDLRRATGVATVIERDGVHRFEIHRRPTATLRPSAPSAAPCLKTRPSFAAGARRWGCSSAHWRWCSRPTDKENKT